MATCIKATPSSGQNTLAGLKHKTKPPSIQAILLTLNNKTSKMLLIALMKTSPYSLIGPLLSITYLKILLQAS